MDSFDVVVRRAFGEQVTVSELGSRSGIGRRIEGIDLAAPLSPEQAEVLVNALDHFAIVSLPGQHESGFDVAALERIANHFGAPIPHPSNCTNYGSPDAVADLKPIADRTTTKADAAFPDFISCAPGADSAAVYLVSNLVGSGPDAVPVFGGGQHWHTDIEFEPVPLSTSMFYVQSVPSTRAEGDGTWVTNPPREPGFYHPESSDRLAELREALPLNGETAYADTAAAYAALEPAEQHELDAVLIRRRLRPDDDGWLAPLVHTNPRSGRKSLHSPIWASRGKRVAPAVVDGLDEQGSREFLDRLEQHCLQPQFRYDHVHQPGDVTIWDNFATVHVAPPSKRVIDDPADARLMYRISCKGQPAFELPRDDADDWIAQNIVPPYRSSVAS